MNKLFLIADEIQNSLSIRDNLGLHIDCGIFSTVVMLRVFGFITSGSCEGHNNWGLKYPWVDIDFTQKAEEKLINLLNIFSLNKILKIQKIGIFGDFRLCGQDNKIRDMNKFSYLLLKNYLNNKGFYEKYKNG